MSCTPDPVETEEYRGYTIEIYHDDSPQNPFESWDSEPPIAIYSDRNIHEYATRYGHANEVPALSYRKGRQWLIDTIGETETNEYLDNYGRNADGVYEAIREEVDTLNYRERLEALEELYRCAGMPAVVDESRGYSQGDWAEVLAVATPEFLKATGCTKKQCEANDYELLRAAIKLYGYWAWGDVYGFVIKDAAGEEIDDGPCWGFYGDYPEYGGSIDEAKATVDNHIAYETKQHFKQVKTWIKNHVPLYARTPLCL